MKKLVLAAALTLMAVPAMAATPGVLGVGQGGPNTLQYHSYDGLICTDCHTLHGSENGAVVSAGDGVGNWTGGTGYRELLKKGDWTDMCLSCHMQGNETSATVDLPGVTNSGWVAPIVMTTDGVDPVGISMPAGDFYYSNADEKKGHNPAYTKGSMAVATSKLMKADSVLGSTPPGGTITDGEWSCHSCHGMHSRFSGSYAPYRQLKRKVNSISVSGDVSGFGTETVNGGTTAAGFEPIKSNSRGDLGATGLVYSNLRKDGQAVQGADLFADYNDTNKNVYQGGFSSFCSACHGQFHGGNGEARTADNANTRVANAWIKHPTNVTMDMSTGSKYGITTYKAAITNAQGNNPNPVGYDFRYPLVKADADFTVKTAVASASDATTLATTDRIMCLTCHKAHASEFENMTRWDTNAHSFIAVGAADVEGYTYDSAAGAFQKSASLGDNPAFGCGKCHQKGGTKAYVKSF